MDECAFYIYHDNGFNTCHNSRNSNLNICNLLYDSYSAIKLLLKKCTEGNKWQTTCVQGCST